jgi:hypothetical protein
LSIPVSAGKDEREEAVLRHLGGGRESARHRGVFANGVVEQEIPRRERVVSGE